MIKPSLQVFFYRSEAGNEPVLDWIRGLHPIEKKIIGAEIKTVQIGWPLGMPLVRKMEKDLWEIRVTLPNRIARILFTMMDDRLVLLHGFIKKSQATPKEDLKIAMSRLKKSRSEE